MMNFSFYPGDEDRDTGKANAADGLNDPAEEDGAEDTETTAPDADADDLLEEGDGIEEGEEIE